MNLKRALTIATAALIASGSITALSMTEAQPAAACNLLSLPSIGIERCVVGGGQAQIDAGNVVRYSSLSSTNVDWLAGHRSSHGSTFAALPNIRVGHQFRWEGRTYTVQAADVVNRHNPGYVMSWTQSDTPTVVLQTSHPRSGYVYVWRATAAGAPTPPPPPPTTTIPPPPPAIPTATTAGAAVDIDFVDSQRIYDTRQTGTPVISGSWRAVKLPDVYADRSVAAVNVTAVGKGEDSYVSSGHCGTTTPPGTSTLNVTGTEAAGNFALVPVTDGNICFYAHNTVELIVDLIAVNGNGNDLRHNPQRPTRALDTRQTSTPLQPWATRQVTATPGATAISATITGVDSAGWIVAHACDTTPGTSSVNTKPGVATANQIWVELDAAGTFCVTSNVTGHVVVDITGTFSDTGSLYQPLTMTRLIDTRIPNSAEWNANLGGKALGDSVDMIELPAAGKRGIAADITGYAINIASTQAANAGYLTVWPCDTARPTASALNPRAGVNVAASTIAATPQGRSCLYSHNAGHVVVDVTGVWVNNQAR